MSLVRPLRAAAVAAGIATALATPQAVQAAALTAEQVLQQFNLVVFTDMTGGHDVEGRALIQGNLNGGNTTPFFIRGTTAPASAYPALTVGGNLNAPVNMNDGGGIAVGGNVTGMVNMNGGGTATVAGSVTGTIQGGPTVLGPVDVPDFAPVMKALSAQLQALTANATAQIAGSKATFNATGLGSTAVFDIDGDTFFSAMNELDFVLGGATTIVINVSGLELDPNENFLGGVGATIADNVIWNFYEATDIDFGTEYFGAILAPYAEVTNVNALNGAVIVDKFTQGGEVHQHPFAGDLPDPAPTPDPVPEPSALALLGLGLLGLASTARRRRKR